MTNYIKHTLKKVISETDALEFQIQNHSLFLIESNFRKDR